MTTSLFYRRPVIRPWLVVLVLMFATAMAGAAPPQTQPGSFVQVGAKRPTPSGPGPAVATQPASFVQVGADGNVTVRGTLEAAMDYPQVMVRLKRNGKAVMGDPTALGSLTGLGDMKDLDSLIAGASGGGGGAAGGAQGDDSFAAYLDTGASAYVICKTTAARFKIAAVPGAMYHEAGLHGDAPMGVSVPYDLAITGTAKGAGPTDAYFPVQSNAVFQLNPVEANPLVEMVTGEVNVIGTPAIRKFLVEINTGNPTQTMEQQLAQLNNIDLGDLSKPGVLEKLEGLEGGPSVRLHNPAKDKPGPVDLVIPLTYITFSRRHNPQDKGPLPDLADNPTVRGVRTSSHQHTFTGNFLLDTGAPTSMISTKQATALGIYDQAGQPLRDPDYALPMGGINGKVDSVPGYRIAHLTIPCAGGKTLDFRGVTVFVTDISTTLDGGKTVTLDGILGTNLWFPTVDGLDTGFPTDTAPSAFQKIWIDGPGGRLMLELQK